MVNILLLTVGGNSRLSRSVADLSNTVMDIRNRHMNIDYQLGLKEGRFAIAEWNRLNAH